MPLVEDNPLDPKYNPITFDEGAAYSSSSSISRSWHGDGVAAGLAPAAAVANSLQASVQVRDADILLGTTCKGGPVRA